MSEQQHGMEAVELLDGGQAAPQFKTATWSSPHWSVSTRRNSADREALRRQGSWRPLRKKPIAPGKKRSPLPPWDPLLPGAFFARSWYDATRGLAAWPLVYSCCWMVSCGLQAGLNSSCTAADRGFPCFFRSQHCMHSAVQWTGAGSADPPSHDLHPATSNV